MYSCKTTNDYVIVLKRDPANNFVGVLLSISITDIENQCPSKVVYDVHGHKSGQY